MAYGYFKDLNRRADKVFRDKTFNITKDAPNMIGINVDLVQSGSGIKNENISNKELAEVLHKPIITQFDRSKVHSPFIDNIWSANLADMQLIAKFNKGFRFLLFVVGIYSKYIWVIPLRNKKVLQLLMLFRKL